MTTKRINNETAKADFERWLAFKKIRSIKREANIPNEENLVDAIEECILIVEEDCTLVLTLQFPILNSEGENEVETLRFKPRVNMKLINAKLKAFKGDDADGRVIGYISAVTGENSGIIRSLDTEDYNICQSIALYFL